MVPSDGVDRARQRVRCGLVTKDDLIDIDVSSTERVGINDIDASRLP